MPNITDDLKIYGSELSFYSCVYPLSGFSKKKDVLSVIKSFVLKSSDLIESYPVNISFEESSYKIAIKHQGDLIGFEPSSLILYRYYIKNDAVYKIGCNNGKNFTAEICKFANLDVLQRFKQGMVYKDLELMSLGEGVEEKFGWSIISPEGSLVLDKSKSGFFDSDSVDTRENKKIFDELSKDVEGYIKDNQQLIKDTKQTEKGIEFVFVSEAELKDAYKWLLDCWADELDSLVLNKMSISLDGSEKIIGVLKAIIPDNYKVTIR